MSLVLEQLLLIQPNTVLFSTIQNTGTVPILKSFHFFSADSSLVQTVHQRLNCRGLSVRA